MSQNHSYDDHPSASPAYTRALHALPSTYLPSHAPSHATPPAHSGQDSPITYHHLTAVTALCERIAACGSRAAAIDLVTLTLPDLLPLAHVEVQLLDSQPTPPINAAASATPTPPASTVERALPTPFRLSRLRQRAISQPLIAAGASLGLLIVEPDGPADITEQQHLALRLIGAALAQTLARHATAPQPAPPTPDEAIRWEAFLGQVAHEVRTPLTCINGYSQLLRRQTHTLRDANGAIQPAGAIHLAEACERHLPQLERQVTHIERLMRDLLDLARLQHGPFTLTVERCDLTDLTRRALRDVDDFRDCRLTLHLPAPVWAICDARRIEQLLYDTTHAAIRAGGFGGELCVSVWSAPWRRVPHVFALIGSGAPRLTRNEQRALQRAFGGASDESLYALGLTLGAMVARHSGGVLTHLPRASGGSAFVLALPAHGSDTPALTAATLKQRVPAPTTH